jgi:hypothetical protein
VRTRSIRWLAPLMLVLIVGAVAAYGATTASTSVSKTVPTCKKGQKSTKAHPCKVAKKKTVAKAPTPAKPTTTTTSSKTATPSTSGSSSAAAGGGGAANPDGCPAGQTIPVGGDNDADNDGGPSDGDGCI